MAPAPTTETRFCALHGETLHRADTHRTLADGTKGTRWSCTVCQNDRIRVLRHAQRRAVKAPSRKVKPLAPLLPGAVRPANQTFPPDVEFS